MKKLLLMLILVGIKLHAYAQVSLPYTENFESGPGGWTDSSQVSGWGYGTPSTSLINTANSGTKAWFTKSIGLEKGLESFYLTSPVFDLTTRSNPNSYLALSFYQFLALEGRGEASQIEYKINGGEWTTLGSTTSGGVNWYNYTIFYYYHGWLSTYRPWEKCTHAIALDEYSKSLQIRFVYIVDLGENSPNLIDGVAIDDISLVEINKPGFSKKDSLCLVALYNATDGKNWTNNSGWLKDKVENWVGVGVFSNDFIRLDLSNNNLTGQIPKELCLLSVHYINLSHNNLYGNIPVELGNLTSVEALNLSHNKLSGSMPKEIGNLHNAQRLDFSYNSLTGTFSDFEIFGLENLNLSNNNLEGEIPSFRYLVGFLYLEGNKFSSISPNFIAPHEFTIYSNKLTFKSLESFIKTIPDVFLKVDSYAPQDSIGALKTVIVDAYSPTILSADYTGNSPNNQYQWYKDGSAVSPILSTPTFNLINIPPSFIGEYHCRITNKAVPGLTLYTRIQTVISRAANTKVIYRVNCGGTETVTDKPINWDIDSRTKPSPFYVPSSTTLAEGTCWWPNRTNTTGAPNCVFGSFRVEWGGGALKYNFPVSKGKYEVKLYFAAKKSSSTVPGKTFDVKIENGLVLDNFDIFVAAGYEAIVKLFVVDVVDGNLNIELLKQAYFPQINAIEISSLTSATATMARIDDQIVEDEKVGEEQITAYPNPLIGDYLTVTLPGLQGEVTIELVDQQGVLRMSSKREILIDNPTINLDVKDLNLQPGLYFLSVKSKGTATKMTRIIKN